MKTIYHFNLPSLVLKARHLGGSAFCNFYSLGVPEQALCGILLGFRIIVEDKASELLCVHLWTTVLIECSLYVMYMYTGDRDEMMISVTHQMQVVYSCVAPCFLDVTAFECSESVSVKYN